MLALFAAASGPAAGAAAPTPPLDLWADTVRVDARAQVLEASGRVRITVGRYVARCARATYLLRERRLVLRGEVTVATPDGDLAAQEVTVRLTADRTVETIEAAGAVEMEAQRRVLSADFARYTARTRTLLARGRVRVFVPPDLVAAGDELRASGADRATLTGRVRLQNRDGVLRGRALVVDGRAQTAVLSGGVEGQFHDTRITAGTATLVGREEKVVFADRVTIARPGQVMTADRVTLFYRQNRFIAEGTTRVRLEEDRPDLP